MINGVLKRILERVFDPSIIGALVTWLMFRYYGWSGFVVGVVFSAGLGLLVGKIRRGRNQVK